MLHIFTRLMKIRDLMRLYHDMLLSILTNELHDQGSKYYILP